MPQGSRDLRQSEDLTRTVNIACLRLRRLCASLNHHMYTISPRDMLFLLQALMAKEAVLKFNPSARIVAHHGNVKGAEFGLTFIRKFDIVLNALDNVDARR